ncbi:hypothetical protein GPECTOR_198g346 [Gonium pectorale]|uniref:Malonyl-CoA decarboxylase C-terminal domain-containing protein n=1 Tax=Gonium pectorale TaxID=33097 RepID=A0A150FYK4_GONPE|nr:hypothetical protein GPECTOR_198g346 [Gonium pectorale]|eukprot:KXZ42130.1 hypothetical protein GPECTOR_198g346 [Gonium pectorale]
MGLSVAAAGAAAGDVPPAEAGFHDALYRAADRLSSSCQPLYTQLFLPISQAPEGMKFLVDMRSDLLTLAAQQAAPAESAPLRAMADHLRQALAEWFSVGLLQLQPISWQESPAALLERVMRAEAVHPLTGWEELRQRLGPRRRVFAFTHPSMPGEPLVVLHTALMDGPASSMEEILDRGRGGASASGPPHLPPSRAPGLTPHPPPPPPVLPPSTAVFYSISSSQPGLRGIELGHFLIKRVADLLLELQRQQQQQPPQPQFDPEQAAQSGARTAETGQGRDAGAEGPLLLPNEAKEVLRLATELGWRAVCEHSSASAGAAAALSWLLEGDRWLAAARASAALPSWPPHDTPSKREHNRDDDRVEGSDPGGSVSGWRQEPPLAAAPAGARAAAGVEEVLRPLLLRLAARYLAVEKRRRFALCPVAHFHLRNGASLWRLNWRYAGARVTAKGLRGVGPA